MTHIISAEDLCKETIAYLPPNSLPDAYKRANRLKPTWELRNNEPHPNSVLRRAVGDKLVLFLSGFDNQIAVGTIVKVNKATVKVTYSRPNWIKPAEVTINEIGEVRGETGHSRTETYFYSEGNFEQMLEVQQYYCDLGLRTTAARNELKTEMVVLASRLHKFTLDEVQTILKALRAQPSSGAGRLIK